jgi:hypothetical protein
MPTQFFHPLAIAGPIRTHARHLIGLKISSACVESVCRKEANPISWKRRQGSDFKLRVPKNKCGVRLKAGSPRRARNKKTPAVGEGFLLNREGPKGSRNSQRLAASFSLSSSSPLRSRKVTLSSNSSRSTFCMKNGSREKSRVMMDPWISSEPSMLGIRM